jgi:hypothetical protein
MQEGYHVFCWNSDGEPSEGEYVLASRQKFPTRKAAEKYARTIHRSRCPLIIPREDIVRAAVQSRDCEARWLRD